MKPIKDICGQTFGKLTVVSFSHRVVYNNGHNSKAYYWNCVCECGNETKVGAPDLKSGKSKSCGGGHHKQTHGMSRTPIYRAWDHMRQRCLNKDNKYYSGYGGRGITVCDRWLNSFENFFADMGPKPTPKHSIERDDNDGNYEPSNCRWATSIEQMNNTRMNRYTTYGDKTLSTAQWSVFLGVSYDIVRRAIKTNKFESLVIKTTTK